MYCIAVTSDLHFTRDNYRYKLNSDKSVSLFNRLSVADKVILAGDTFDISLAGHFGIRKEILKKIIPARAELVILAGNHDYYLAERENAMTIMIHDDIIITHGHYFDIWGAPADFIFDLMNISVRTNRLYQEYSHPVLSLLSTDMTDSETLMQAYEAVQSYLTNGEKRKEIKRYIRNVLTGENPSWWDRVKAKYFANAVIDVIDRIKMRDKQRLDYFELYALSVAHENGLKNPRVIYGHTHKPGVREIACIPSFNTGSWDNMMICYIDNSGNIITSNGERYGRQNRTLRITQQD